MSKKGAWTVVRNGKSYSGESLEEAQAKADVDQDGKVITT